MFIHCITVPVIQKNHRALTHSKHGAATMTHTIEMQLPLGQSRAEFNIAYGTALSAGVLLAQGLQGQATGEAGYFVQGKAREEFQGGHV